MNHPLVQHALAIAKPFAAVRPNLRLVLAALCAMGILHICATLSAPVLMGRSAFDRLAPLLPMNSVLVLPPSRPTRSRCHS